jgi:hypothetical protein
MIGPDWKRAPPWAKFVAMDSSGAWWWYEERPALAEDLGIWTASGHKTAAVVHQGWVSSLSERDAKGDPCAIRLIGDAAKDPASVEDWLRAGWTPEQMIEHGYAERVP